MARIFDAVYGYIELNEIESELVNSPVFQRLHWIKQLGPLSTVFPSAQHSRFSHSLGVFHIMKKMIKHLRKSSDSYFSKIPEDDIKTLRLAALLHDIGHVPFSHIGENVLKKACATLKTPSIIDVKRGSSWKSRFQRKLCGDATKLHESLSAEVILNSEEIDQILAKNSGWENTEYRKRMKEKIALIIVGQPENQVFRALLHSELDADRLDYLLRDSFFTGVNYGHIDLDYIISRFKVIMSKDGLPLLCLDKKGLHTVEHYILARFFLHTQVVFDRRVKLLDLAFEDVMKYLVLGGSAEEWGLMNLDEVLGCVRNSKGEGKRKHQHLFYEYTDAQVHMKMRSLHNNIDIELREAAKEPIEEDKEKAYINDCTKIIMDGKIPKPCITRQKLVSISTLKEKEYIDQLTISADEIAEKIAADNNIFVQRIKTCIMHQSVMKYTELSEAEEDRLEAVKIDISEDPSVPDIRPAAKSNASILGGLIDKLLLVFNVYYIPSKTEGDIHGIESAIEHAFKSFVSANFLEETKLCACGVEGHLCQVIGSEGGFEIIKGLSKNPQYICRKCGRVSSDDERLCDGINIDS